MITKSSEESNMVCSEARKRFAALEEEGTRHETSSATERAATRRHLQACSRCAFEYRLFALQRSTLDAAAAQEPITPDEDFFRALRARIARGPVLPSRAPDESWTAALLLTARQLIPAMAMLLLLILGATLLWDQPSNNMSQAAAVRPRDRVMFSDMYDYPAPTREDVLDTLVVVEEKENGK